MRPQEFQRASRKTISATPGNDHQTMIELTLSIYGKISSPIENPLSHLPEIGLMEFERIAKAAGRYATDPSEAGNTSLAFYPFDVDLHLEPREGEGNEGRELITAQFDVWPEYPPFSIPFQPIIEFTKHTLDLFVSAEISGVSVELEIPSNRIRESTLITDRTCEHYSHDDSECGAKQSEQALGISIEHCKNITFNTDVFMEKLKNRLGQNEDLNDPVTALLSPSEGREVEYTRNSYLRHICTEGIKRHSFICRMPRAALTDISRIIGAAFLAHQEAIDQKNNDQETVRRARFTIHLPRRSEEYSNSPRTRRVHSNSDQSLQRRD